MRCKSSLLWVVLLGYVTVSLGGCPIIFPPPADEARVVVLLSRDATKQGPVDTDDIESLVVTITEISFDGVGNGDGPETTTVDIEDNEFEPATVTVAEGDTVKWVATTDTFHTVTSGDGPADLDAGDAFDFNFLMEDDMASVLFEEVAFNTGTTRLLLTDVDGSQSIVENPPFDLVAGQAIFPYFCIPHFDVGMVGEVRVVPADEPGPSDVVVFSGAVDVDLMQLDELSEILSSVEVPPGNYTKIRLSISNPRLVMADDPGTVITDVHLTANGRLFISENFEVMDGEDLLLILVFEDLHLVELGNGGFVLTPQLRADVQLTPAAATATGEILSVDAANDSLVLSLPEGDITVHYSATTEIFLTTDVGTPTGTEANLLVGVEIQVDGTLSVNGDITAATILLL